MAFVMPMTDKHERLHAIVKGVVQGVNFRYYTQERAHSLRLTGWVRNRADGAVEVLAEGPRASLDQLREFLRRGPPAASVTEVKEEWPAPTGEFKWFDIRF
jgi:acylphosphatase